MDLVIVESPTKAKTLSKFLGSGYKIEASMGHVRDLPEKGGGLAIDLAHDFAPTYVVLDKKKARVAELKKIAKEAKVIYLASDPDREGEAIAYHVQYLLGKHDFRRVTFHEITKTAIEEALQHPGVVDMQLVNAHRRHPLFFSVRNQVEVSFHFSRKFVSKDSVKIRDQKVDNCLANCGGVETFLFLYHVPTILDSRDNRRIGTRSSDPPLL